MSQLKNIYPEELLIKQKENIIMFDVRRQDEWETTGIIKGAIPLTFFDMFGNHDVVSWLHEFQKHITSKEQEFILICAHANRTQTIGNYLINSGYKNVNHLAGGMALWEEEGRETVSI